MKLKPGVRVPVATCPYCGSQHDHASGLSAHYPEPGDVSVCIQCGGSARYTDSLSVEKWPADKPLPPEAIVLQKAIREIRS